MPYHFNPGRNSLETTDGQNSQPRVYSQTTSILAFIRHKILQITSIAVEVDFLYPLCGIVCVDRFHTFPLD